MRTDSETRSRSRRWFIAFVVALSLIAVVDVFFLSGASTHRNRILAQRSGAVALSADELVDVVRSEKLVAYWLGPISGSKYTLVASGNGVVTVTYLSGGTGIDNPFQNNLVFETVGNNNLKSALVAPSSEVDNARVKTVTGNTFSYDRYLTDHMKVQIKGNPLQVIVFYPHLRSVSSIQTDVDALQRVG